MTEGLIREEYKISDTDIASPEYIIHIIHHLHLLGMKGKTCEQEDHSVKN